LIPLDLRNPAVKDLQGKMERIIREEVKNPPKEDD